MKRFFFGFITYVCLMSASGLAAPQTTLQLERQGDALRLSYPGQAGFTYTLEISADLTHWEAAGLAQQGADAALVEDPIPPTERARFYRVVCQAMATEIAPDPVTMGGYLVGTTWQNIRFTDTNRFTWFSEPGNWNYTRTGDQTGLLVMTYDSDANNPAIYREEIALTFATPTSGTMRYSELTHGVEDPGSVSTRNFNFDLAPTVAVFTARVLGKTWEGYHFLDAARFERPGTPSYPGNWSYAKTGLRTARLVFTYDQEGNDPGIYREELVLTFTSSGLLIAGNYRYSEYLNGVEDPGSVVLDRSFFLP